MNSRTRLAIIIALLATALLAGGYNLYNRYNQAEVARQNAEFRASLSPDSVTHTGRIVLSETDDRTLLLAQGHSATINSLLNISKKMTYGTYVWNERGAATNSKVWVRVDLATQTLSVFRGDDEIGTGVVLYGADSHPTPLGRFPVMAKMRDHKSRTYDDAPMPFTLRLTDDGVSIHGSDVRKGLATHGCIGIPRAFAEQIFTVVSEGDPVYIVNGSATG